MFQAHHYQVTILVFGGSNKTSKFENSPNCRLALGTENVKLCIDDNEKDILINYLAANNASRYICTGITCRGQNSISTAPAGKYGIIDIYPHIEYYNITYGKDYFLPLAGGTMATAAQIRWIDSAQSPRPVSSKLYKDALRFDRTDFETDLSGNIIYKTDSTDSSENKTAVISATVLSHYGIGDFSQQYKKISEGIVERITNTYCSYNSLYNEQWPVLGSYDAKYYHRKSSINGYGLTIISTPSGTEKNPPNISVIPAENKELSDKTVYAAGYIASKITQSYNVGIEFDARGYIPGTVNALQPHINFVGTKYNQNNKNPFEKAEINRINFFIYSKYGR